jgi:hypothetical protein
MKLNGATGINSYKLARFVNNYVTRDVRDRQDLQENIGSVDRIERTILSGGAPDEQTKTSGIRSRTARTWLKRLGYNWQDVKKGVFLDGHERDDVVEYRQKFLEDMHRLLPCLVEFVADGSIQEKVYPADGTVGGPDRRPIVMITHDESIFSANDGKHQQ